MIYDFIIFVSGFLIIQLFFLFIKYFRILNIKFSLLVAAPDMLCALRAFVSSSNVDSHIDDPSASSDAYSSALNQAREAILKAEGKS